MKNQVSNPRIVTSAGPYAWAIVAVVWLAGFSAPANMAKVTTLAPVIMEVFGIGPETIGWIIALFYALGIILAFPAAGIINRFGIKACVIVSIICGALGSLAGVVSENLAIFMASRILEGAGMGLLTVAGPAAITPWFPPARRGLPLGIWGMWVALAMFVCPIIYAAVAESAGWRIVWWITFFFDIVVLVLFSIVYRDPDFVFEDEVPEHSNTRPSLGRVLRNRTVWALGFVFFFDQLAVMAVNNFTTTYLTTVVGVTLTLAATMASVAAAIGTLCSPLAGKISDAFKTRRWVLVVGCIAGVIYTAAYFNTTSIELIWVLIVIGGVVGGVVPAMIFAATPEQVDPADVPNALAMVSFTQNVGMFVGATILGTAVTAIGWSSAALFILAPCFVIATLIAVFTRSVR